jgi:hypothetical protein
MHGLGQRQPRPPSCHGQGAFCWPSPQSPRPVPRSPAAHLIRPIGGRIPRCRCCPSSEASVDVSTTAAAMSRRQLHGRVFTGDSEFPIRTSARPARRPCPAGSPGRRARAVCRRRPGRGSHEWGCSSSSVDHAVDPDSRRPPQHLGGSGTWPSGALTTLHPTAPHWPTAGPRSSRRLTNGAGVRCGRDRCVRGRAGGL